MLHSVTNPIESAWRNRSRDEATGSSVVSVDPTIQPSENVIRELRSLSATLLNESSLQGSRTSSTLTRVTDTPLFNLMPDGLVILDTDSIVVAANHAFFDLLELDTTSVTGFPFQDFVSADELVHMIGIGSFFEDDTFTGVPMKFFSARGEVRTVSVSGSRVYEADSTLAGFVLTIHDTREFHKELNGHSRSLAKEKDRNVRLENAKQEAEDRSQFITESVLKRYVAPSVINDILEGDVDFDKEAELENVTVLFCDLAGFTRASEELGAIAVSNIINEFFTVMSDVIFEYGGTIDKFIGDSIMAIFGAPKEMAPEEQALRAVECAKAMQQAMEGLKLIWSTDGAAGLELRVGIHQGDAVVGNFGSYRRVDYTCIGSNVNLASRIESVCEPGQVFISEVVAGLLRPEASELAGMYQLKGIEPAQALYRVHG